MSNRTSEANKAISLAWINEQQLVREGKGTRDWTPEQQQDILDRGKAYGDDRKAFEGHHMKSAAKFPKYQGNPDNIQFLSRSEHFSAHDGNFTNHTNGHFDPYSGVTSNFGSSKYEPCKILELSKPIINPMGGKTQAIIDNTYTSASINASSAFIPPNINNSKKRKLGSMVKRLVGEGKRLMGKGVKFYVRHKNIIDPIAITFATVIAKESLSGGLKNSSSHYENDDEYTTYSLPTDVSAGDTTASTQHVGIIERSSPSEHTVSPHRQRYGKDKVWKDKEPYTRSKNSDE